MINEKSNTTIIKESASGYSEFADLYGHHRKYCDNCGEEVNDDFTLTNSYGDVLCEDCWDEYINSKEGLVEYVISIANTDEDIDDFEPEELIRMAESWNENKTNLKLSPARIKKIEKDAMAVGFKFDIFDAAGNVLPKEMLYADIKSVDDIVNNEDIGKFYYSKIASSNTNGILKGPEIKQLYLHIKDEAIEYSSIKSFDNLWAANRTFYEMLEQDHNLVKTDVISADKFVELLLIRFIFEDCGEVDEDYLISFKLLGGSEYMYTLVPTKEVLNPAATGADKFDLGAFYFGRAKSSFAIVDLSTFLKIIEDQLIAAIGKKDATIEQFVQTVQQIF